MKLLMVMEGSDFLRLEGLVSTVKVCGAIVIPPDVQV